MILVVVLSGFGLLALPVVMRRAGRRLQPGQWAGLCTVALLGGTALTLGSAIVIAVPPGFDMVGLPTIGRACQRMLGGLYPGGVAGSAVAAFLVLSACGLAIRALIHTRRSADHARAGSSAGTWVGRRGRFEVVVVPDERRYALSVPRGWCGGQMLISQGVVDALSPSELELVCAHEEAHLSLGHRRYLKVALVIEGIFWFWPPSKASAGTLRLALERWADEVAAGESSESRRRLRGALLSVAGVTPLPALAAFSSVDGLMERIRALDAHPRRAHLGWWLLVLAPGLLIAGIAALASTSLGHQAYCLVAMSRYCGGR